MTTEAGRTRLSNARSLFPQAADRTANKQIMLRVCAALACAAHAWALWPFSLLQAADTPSANDRVALPAFKHPVPVDDVGAVVLTRVASSLSLECRRRMLEDIACVGDADFTRVALAATTCHYQLTGRAATDPCPAAWPAKQCVAALDSERFQVFTTFAQDADRICREVLASQWVGSVEELLNALAGGSSRALDSLDGLHARMHAMSDDSHAQARTLAAAVEKEARAIRDELGAARSDMDVHHADLSAQAIAQAQHVRAMREATAALDGALQASLALLAEGLARQQRGVDSANEALSSFLPVLTEVATLAKAASQAGWVEATAQAAVFYVLALWAARALAALSPGCASALAAALCSSAVAELSLHDCDPWAVRSAHAAAALVACCVAALAPRRRKSRTRRRHRQLAHRLVTRLHCASEALANAVDVTVEENGEPAAAASLTEPV